MTNVAENVMRLAGMHLIPQNHLAEHLGMSRQGINNLFRGRSNASLTTMTKAATFFGVSLDDLIADSQVCLRAAVEAFNDAPARQVELH